MNDDKDAPAPAPAGARYEIRDDLPDGEILVPIDGPTGTVMAVRRGHMSPELVAAINGTLAWMIQVGLWRHR